MYFRNWDDIVIATHLQLTT